MGGYEGATSLLERFQIFCRVPLAYARGSAPLRTRPHTEARDRQRALYT